jgi:hypothetical protein
MKNITYDQVLELIAETNLQIKTASDRTDKQIAKTSEEVAETSRKIAKMSEELAETGRYLKEVGKRVDDVTDTLGRFAEEQVRPKILELFRARGIELEETYPRVRVEKNGQYLLEIDLLLVNTIYSVAVEVKNTLRQKDIDDHLERMQKLQQTPSRTIKGTTMYGAVAGMIVTDEVANYAIKKGFYVIKPKGDTVEISNKADFKPKEWAVVAQ